MRWYILDTLIRKEAARHLANRGGVGMMLLLAGAAGLLGLTNPKATPGGGTAAPAGLALNANQCFVHFDTGVDPNWIEALRAAARADPSERIALGRGSSLPRDADGNFVYPPRTGVIRLTRDADGTHRVAFRSAGDPAEMAPYEQWLLAATCDHYAARANQPPPSGAGEFWPYLVALDRYRVGGASVPAFAIDRVVLGGDAIDPRGMIVVCLVAFALFLVCVYLLAALTCEERERGVLLAQALSPASPAEILTAKLLFYPGVALVLCGLIAGLYDARVLGRPYFWATVAVLAAGSLGVGMTVASLAKTQRAASLGSLSYGLGVSLFVLICTRNNSPLNNLALEYHGPRMLLAAVSGQIGPGEWLHLVVAAVLAAGWFVLAVVLFRSRGWQ